MNPRFILVPSIDDIPKIRPKNAFYAHLDGADCPTSLALHQQLKQIFELPEYFGDNMDALYDCLLDLEWIVEDNVILVIEHPDQLLIEHEENDPDLISDVLILFDEVAEGWQLYDGEEFTPKNFKIIMVASSKMKLLLEENEIEYELVSSTK
ncbi:MAG: barstar family protein [Saprospiraceae bacterium]|jgi:RNAse (barnase) inhibitor barstar|nr:barstar family protein [Candidatus Defluviibacterium haderslevense]MBK8244756.1 barstar family protein [Candidatus Defluviibacterium haderslevense]MCI1267884.1 barstar family protein [Saprospiraceae bacterium]